MGVASGRRDHGYHGCYQGSTMMCHLPDATMGTANVHGGHLPDTTMGTMDAPWGGHGCVICQV